MKKLFETNSIKQKVMQYVTGVAIAMGVFLTIIMIVSSFILTDRVLLDTLQMMAKTSSNNVSSNLHLLTDRMANISVEAGLTSDTLSVQEKNDILAEKTSRIEFVWLAAYDTEGNKLFGDEAAPASVAQEKYYRMMSQTANLVIGETFEQNSVLQLTVGAPLRKDGELAGYVIGSYKYDMLNDVLSGIRLGKSGSAYIVNEDGIIVAHQEIEQITQKNNIYDLYTTSKNKAVFDKVVNRQTGADTMSLHHSNHYVAYSPIPGVNWALIIDAPKSEFLGVVYIALIISVVLSICLTGIARLVVSRLAEQISTSLSSATRRLEAFAEGNLKDEVEQLKTGDEAEVLASALAQSISRIDRYIEDISKSLGAFSDGDYAYEIPDNFNGDFAALRKALLSISEALNKTMRQVNVTSIDIGRNSDEISDYARQLYDGSSRQTEALGGLNEFINHIIEKLDLIDENSNLVSHRADAANEKVVQGNQQMNDMLATMNDITSNMEEIMEISQMIEEIASQTRLLSLNASIEAARAGEAGRGFAVVAEEIGALSDQTASALQQTSNIIVRSNQAIEKGMETAKGTANALKEIDSATEEFSKISANLIQIVAEQKAAVDQMTTEIASVQEIAVMNQKLAEQTDAKTEQFQAQANELKEFVSQVKLREER